MYAIFDAKEKTTVFFLRIRKIGRVWARRAFFLFCVKKRPKKGTLRKKMRVRIAYVHFFFIILSEFY